MKDKQDYSDAIVTANELYPINIEVKSIAGINYIFDPQRLQPWSSEVVKYGSVYRSYIQKSPFFSNNFYISDIDELRTLIILRSDIIQNYYTYAADSLYYDPDKPQTIEKRFELAALLINLAKCWEDLAMRFNYIFRKTDRIAADNLLHKLYRDHVEEYYSKALAVLIHVGNIFVIDDNEMKSAWATMTLYAFEKAYATRVICRQDKMVFKDENIREINALLIKHGQIEHLIEYTENSHSAQSDSEADILAAAKKLIWSAWKSVTDSVCSIGDVTYKPLDTKSTPSKSTSDQEMTRDDNYHSAKKHYESSTLRHRKNNKVP